MEGFVEFPVLPSGLLLAMSFTAAHSFVCFVLPYSKMHACCVDLENRFEQEEIERTEVRDRRFLCFLLFLRVLLFTLGWGYAAPGNPRAKSASVVTNEACTTFLRGFVSSW